MKKIIIFIVLVASLFFVLYPVHNEKKNTGMYNVFSRMIWCKYRSICYHEIAHKLDQESGWTSHTHEFSVAVRAYLIFEFQKKYASSLAWTLMDTPGLFTYDGFFVDHRSEMYAEIFEASHGDNNRMPDRFVEFYNWKRARELIAQIVR